jgi:hypothetical protein
VLTQFKTLLNLFTISLILLHSSNFCTAQDKVLKLTGPYLGQTPPGKTPIVFAPNIISTEANEGCCCFSGNGNLFLFARAGSSLNGILMMHQIDGVWSKPKLAPFSVGKYDWDFMLAPDDKTVFVSSGRPLKKGAPPEKEYRIWISEKNEQGWSEPYLLPYPVNTGQHDSFPSVSKNGTLYFFSNRSGGLGKGDIYKSQREDGIYIKVENLKTPINTKYHEVDPFIAPDESYIIFCSEKPGGFGKADIYVTFHKKDKTWSKPINLGNKINSSHSEYIPYITPDGKYFFFTSNKSGNRDIYWVDANIIYELKPKGLK